MGILLALLVGAGAQIWAPGWTAASLAAKGKALGGEYIGSHIGEWDSLRTQEA